MKRGHRSFTLAFKAKAVALVQQQVYTVAQACQALGIALRRWVAQVEGETAVLTFAGKGITPERQCIQQLKRQVKRLEMEKPIL